MPLSSTFRYLFSLLLSFGTLLSTLSAQGNGDIDPCSGGMLYYIAFPDTTTNSQDARFTARYPEEFFLYIYSSVDQEVRVGRGSTTVVKRISGGEILEFDTKEVSVPLVSVRNVPQTNVMKIESETPVIIYAYMATRFGCAAFTPVPVEAWGRKYYAATWPGEYVRNIVPAGENNFDASMVVPAPAEILVIAAHDDTEITITPADSLASCITCTSITLDAGEAYLVQSFVDTGAANLNAQADIAGTSVVADKPIGVVSGNTRMWHEPFAEGFLGENSFKDMAVEWLTPIEQHGTEFVFLPTRDTVAQQPGRDPVRDREYVRLYATTDDTTYVVDAASSDSLDAPKPEDGVSLSGGAFWHAVLRDLTNGVWYETTQPAQAYQSPRPVSKFNGTTGSGNFIGVSYKSWGTYMVEMTPREQWTAFAPFKAPSYPSTMRHYVNVVAGSADSARIFYRFGSEAPRPFPFTQRIQRGEEYLVWGTVDIVPGLNYILEGEGGARFGGFVYGEWIGYELYRPGRTERKDDPKGVTTAAGHPSEYEENVAMMYGYPLAPSRCVLERPGEYEVETENDCGIMMITIRAVDTTAAGLRFVRLVNDSLLNENVRLEFLEPVGGLTEESVRLVRLRLSPVDPLRDGRGVVEFRDRTRDGEIRRIEYSYMAERLDADPIEIDFGSVAVNEPAGERLVTLSNPLDREVTVRGLGFALGDGGFVITRSEPSFDWGGGNDSIVLKGGQSLKVWIDVTSRDENRTSVDSLKVRLGCLSIAVPLRVTTVESCLYVSDLQFGVVALGETKTLPLQICNIGSGRVTFHDSGSGKAFLSWLLNEFRVSQADMQKLADAVLEENECLSINVTFSSEEFTGLFRTTARFWANTRSCRDTSVWTAQVVIPGPIVEAYDWGERWVTAQNPCTKNQLTGYEQTIRLSNTGDADFTVRRVEIADDPDDAYRIVDTGSGTTGFVIRPGVVGTVRIAFQPTEQKACSARLRLHYTMNGTADSVDGLLEGIGIESCIQISDLDIIGDTVKSDKPKGIGRLQLRSTGTRPVSISRLSIEGTNASEFSFIGGVSSLPIVIPAGESHELEILFAPTGKEPLERQARLTVNGDFADADCPGSCSDSLAELRGILGTLSVREGESVAGYAIGSISPNPFSREVEIAFTLGKAGMTRVDIYNASGSLVTTLVSESLSTGTHHLVWNGTGVAAGLYHIHIRSGEWSASQQLVLVK